MATKDEESVSALPNDAERNFAANLRDRREQLGMSQADLAVAMSQRGWPFKQITVSRVESNARPLRLSEAEDLAKCVHSNVAALSREPDQIRLHNEILSTVKLLDTSRAAAIVVTADYDGLLERARELISDADTQIKYLDKTPGNALRSFRAELERSVNQSDVPPAQAAMELRAGEGTNELALLEHEAVYYFRLKVEANGDG